jgi:hypothetical protein
VSASNRSSYYGPLRWQAGPILFRSMLSAVVALLTIEAVALADTSRLLWRGVFSALAAVLATLALLSWRTVYLRMRGQFRVGLVYLRSYYEAAILRFRARRIANTQLLSLITELQFGREALAPLLQTDPMFQDMAKNMLFVLIRGNETPLASLVFTSALSHIGLRAESREGVEDFAYSFFGKYEPEKLAFNRVSLVMGQGGASTKLFEMVESSLRKQGIEVVSVPFFLVSETGTQLFPKEIYYKLDAHVFEGLKDYFSRAASLAKKPTDLQPEGDASRAPLIYR